MNKEEIRQRLLLALFGGNGHESDESYVDTKAKFLLEDLVPAVEKIVSETVLRMQDLEKP
jgi:hypothetical protein